jgi:hypothetical protein
MCREIEDVDLIAMELVNHKADDLFAVLGHHPNAIPLPENPEEFFLGPGMLEAGVLNGQDLGHIASDHPANMDPSLGLDEGNRAHRASFHGTKQP